MNHASMEAQAVRIDITPQGEGPVHDVLFSRVLVLRSGKAAVCVINFDLLNIDRETSGRISRRVEERTGIPADHVLICCTHNHDAGLQIPPLLVTDGQGGFKTADRAAVNAMIEPVVAGVEAACRHLEPATLAMGRGRYATPLVVNDRFLLNDQTLAWHYDYTEEDILAPTGPVDPEVGVLHVRGAAGTTIAVLYNYSCHANAYLGKARGTARSADFPGIASAFIEEQLGGTALFIAGAAGDIHPVGVWWEGRGDPEGIHETLHVMGEELGTEVVRAVRQLGTYRDAVCLKGWKRTIRLALRQPGAREDEDMRRALSRERLRGMQEGMLARLRHVAGRAQANSGKTVAGVLQVLRIGDFALAGIPGELFVEYGLELKKRSLVPWTYVATLANDNLGYLPTDSALKMGGYQTWPLHRLEYPVETAGRTLVEECLDMLKEAAGDA